MSTFEKIPSTTALSLPSRSTLVSPRQSPPPSEVDSWSNRDAFRCVSEDPARREARTRRLWAFGSLAAGLLFGVFLTLAFVTAGDFDRYVPANGQAADKPWLLAMAAMGAAMRAAVGRPVGGTGFTTKVPTPATPVSEAPPAPQETPQVALKAEPLTDGRELHLLIPLNAGAHEKHQRHTCRLLLSALVNGYQPTIINWSSNTTDEMQLHREKLRAVAQWLDRADPNDRNAPKDGDLVAMFDSLDVWLQLPPSWLKARYDELIASHRRRVDAGLSRGNAIRDVEVIVGADKVCWPQVAIDSKPCTIAPDSVVPKGLLGRRRALKTGKDAERFVEPWHHGILTDQRYAATYLLGPTRAPSLAPCAPCGLCSGT